MFKYAPIQRLKPVHHVGSCSSCLKQNKPPQTDRLSHALCFPNMNRPIATLCELNRELDVKSNYCHLQEHLQAVTTGYGTCLH